MKLRMFIHDSWPLILLVGVAVFLIGQFPHRVILFSSEKISKDHAITPRFASFVSFEGKAYQELIRRAGISWTVRSSKKASGAIAFDGGLDLLDPLPPPVYLSLPSSFFSSPSYFSFQAEQSVPKLLPRTLAAPPIEMLKGEEVRPNTFLNAMKKELLALPESLTEKRKVNTNDDRTRSFECFFGNRSTP
ncbi:MAG: hypothetical protein J6V88_02355 [Kiritimatiellae bacterium]|nr:hypothetical protein [Kiritimatiellia bacterium]